MATSEGFKDFVLEHLKSANAEFGGKFTFSARKMFGEYCIYVNDSGVQKTLFLVCDEEIFVKKFAKLSEFVAQNEAHFGAGYPYEGAKEHYSIDIENVEFLSALLQILVPLCPAPKAKKGQKGDKINHAKRLIAGLCQSINKKFKWQSERFGVAFFTLPPNAVK